MIQNKNKIAALIVGQIFILSDSEEALTFYRDSILQLGFSFAEIKNIKTKQVLKTIEKNFDIINAERIGDYLLIEVTDFS